MTQKDTVKVAVVQAAPVLFDRQATTESVPPDQEAAGQGAAWCSSPRRLFPRIRAACRSAPRSAAALRRAAGPGRLLGQRRRDARPRHRGAGRGRREAEVYLAIGVMSATAATAGARSTAPCSISGRTGSSRQASQAQAHRRGTSDLGRGRWQHAARRPTGVRPGGRADLLGELHAPGANGDVRQGCRHLSGPHGRPPRQLAGDPAPYRLRRAAASCSAAINLSPATCTRRR